MPFWLKPCSSHVEKRMKYRGTGASSCSMSLVHSPLLLLSFFDKNQSQAKGAERAIPRVQYTRRTEIASTGIITHVHSFSRLLSPGCLP
jgi:hypothetical protein